MQISGNGYNYSMLSNAYTAVSRGMKTTENAAENIASGSALEKDLGASDLTSLKEGEIQAQAGAKLFDVYDKTIGSIIDIEV
jgi:hypothetical protein